MIPKPVIAQFYPEESFKNLDFLCFYKFICRELALMDGDNGQLLSKENVKPY